MSNEPKIDKVKSSHKRALNLTKRVGKYYVGRTIGEGTYAKVKYGQHIDTGETVAIKVLDKEQLVRTGMVDQIKQEINILKHLHHPNVVELKEVMSSKGKIFMVMELITGGELFDKIAAEGPMKEPLARRVFGQLADALDFCHSRGVFHRDLKPENVLLTSELQVKLSDFGLGVLHELDAKDSLLNTTCGTPNYVAPEVLAKQGYDGAKADIWSLGVVLYVILAGCLPFDEDDLVSLFQAISTAHYEIPPWISDDAVDMLRCMLHPHPDRRISMAELWEMPWMQGVKRSMNAQASLPVNGENDIFEEDTSSENGSMQNVTDNTNSATAADKLRGTSSKKLNAFQLVNEVLNINAILHDQDDLIKRHTKFTSEASPQTILTAIEHATVAVGGRVELRPDNRMKLWVPQPKGRLQVMVELFELEGGKRVVDLSKIKGDTVGFYSWYAELTQAIEAIISKQNKHKVLSRPSVGQPRHKMNAFELINSNLSLNALFDSNAENAARHVQFTSKATVDDVFAALEQGTIALGGRIKRSGDKRAHLQVPGGAGRNLEMTVRMFQLTPKIEVVQLTRDAGNSIDMFRFYNRLAAQYLSDVMVKRRDGRQVHPKAMRTKSLLIGHGMLDSCSETSGGSSNSLGCIVESAVEQLTEP